MVDRDGEILLINPISTSATPERATTSKIKDLDSVVEGIKFVHTMTRY
jgi:hypothetical protein